MRVQIRYIRDWVVDYSEPGAVWIVSDWAWYRCAAQGLQPPAQGGNNDVRHLTGYPEKELMRF